MCVCVCKKVPVMITCCMGILGMLYFLKSLYCSDYKVKALP